MSDIERRGGSRTFTQTARAARLPPRARHGRVRPDRRRRAPAGHPDGLRRGLADPLAHHRGDLLHAAAPDRPLARRAASRPARADDQTERAHDQRDDREAVAGVVVGRGGGRARAPRTAASSARGVAAACSSDAAPARDRDDRGRVVGVLGADPAHDLAAGVGLQRLEGQLVAGLAGDLDREPEVLERAGRDRVVVALGGPGDRVDAFGDLAVVGLDRRGRAASWSP